MIHHPLTLTEGSRRMLEQDPHGLSLTLVSILFVFGVLLILYIVYKLTGEWFIRREEHLSKLKSLLPGQGGPDEAVATAIAAALAFYMAETSHEKESGVITIVRRDVSAWKSTPATVRRKQPSAK